MSDKRIPYQRDKTQDERFSILTRFAIAKELERTGQVAEEDVVQVSLPIGVPPKHYAELADRLSGIFPGRREGAGIGIQRQDLSHLYPGCCRYIPRRMLP